MLDVCIAMSIEVNIAVNIAVRITVNINIAMSIAATVGSIFIIYCSNKKGTRVQRSKIKDPFVKTI